MEKTNVMRLLDVRKIEYIAHEYDESIVDGRGVASILKEDPERVFKSLVCADDKHNLFMFVVPVTSELNLKKAAVAAERKSIAMIKSKDLLPLTGYIHGGCSPIGLKKPMPIFIDETAEIFDTIFVSGGKRGFQIELSPVALKDFVKAEFVSLTD